MCYIYVFCFQRFTLYFPERRWAHEQHASVSLIEKYPPDGRILVFLMVYSEEPHSGYRCWVHKKHDLLPCNRARVWYGGWRENACLDFITHYTRSSLRHHLLSYCFSSGPRFDQVAHATLRLSDVKGAIGIYDLVIDTPPTSTGEWNQENVQPFTDFFPIVLYYMFCLFSLFKWKVISVKTRPGVGKVEVNKPPYHLLFKHHSECICHVLCAQEAT